MLNSWQKGRNDEGWKYLMAELQAVLDLDDELSSYRVIAEARRTNLGQSHNDRPKLVDADP